MRQFTKIAVVFALAFLGMATKADHSRNGKYFEISKNIEIFTNLYKEINTYYVDDLDPAKLMRTGVDAMLESLDPYTNYISESEIEGFRYITEGKYNGIGAIIKRVGDYTTIIEPYAVSYTHLRAHETSEHLVCRHLLEKTKSSFSLPSLTHYHYSR